MKEKHKNALAVVGAIALVYLGIRATAVALDPEVHKAIGNASKAVLNVVKEVKTPIPPIVPTT
jgi:hypothetical protein